MRDGKGGEAVAAAASRANEEAARTAWSATQAPTRFLVPEMPVGAPMRMPSTGSNKIKGFMLVGRVHPGTKQAPGPEQGRGTYPRSLRGGETGYVLAL